VHEKLQQIFDIINHLKRTQCVYFDKIIEKQINLVRNLCNKEIAKYITLSFIINLPLEVERLYVYC